MRTNARSLASFLAGLFAIGILLSACDEQNEGMQNDTETQQEGDMQDQNQQSQPEDQQSQPSE